MAISQKRKASHRFGLRAEKIAAWYLRCKGYHIISERYRNTYGEIDLLAWKGRTLVAVEVKARRTLKECEETVPPWKQQKIARALEGFLAGGRYLSGSRNSAKIAGLAQGKPHNIRFDVMWIAPWQWPRHIADAWRM